MLIEKVTVRGFKSYKELTEVNFTSGMNVIIGCNGSGKSNLISAIHFALSEDYGKMRPVQRRALMYNGQESREPSYVEIQFDNRDRRLPVDNDRVVFRRIFGLKKDRLLVNNTEVHEIKTFLNHAGFTNPYFIVKQGQIAQLAMTSDKDRLHFLKEVAGINLFERNQSKSMQLVKQYNLINDEINERLAVIADRLTTLRQEREELSEVADLDLEQRSIEYILTNRQVDDCKLKIVAFESRIQDCRRTWSDSVGDKIEEYKQVNHDILKISDKFIKAETKFNRFNLIRIQIQSEILPLLEQQQQLQQKLNDYEEQLRSGTAESKNTAIRLENLKQELAQQNEELQKSSTKYDRFVQREQAAKKECIEKETEYNTFKNKIARFSEFRSKNERNASIQKELDQVNADSNNNMMLIQDAEIKIQNLECQRQELESKCKDSPEERQGEQDTVTDISQKLVDLKNILHTKKAARDNNWGNLNKYSDKLQLESDAEVKFKENLQKVFGRHLIEGMEGVEKIIQQDEELASGYYGTILDNLDCEDVYNTAIEVVGGSLLVYHIVRSHVESGRIMKKFNEQQLRGEVHFISLDKIVIPQDDQLFQNTENLPNSPVTKILGKMKSPPDQILPAFKFVFGKSLLCQTSDLAVVTAKRYSRTCVTLDGDKFQKSGILSGGYMNPVMSKIKLYKHWNKSKEEAEKLRASIEECRQINVQIEYEIERLQASIEKGTSKKDRLLRNVEKSLKEVDIIKFKLNCNSDALKEAKKHLSELQEKQFQLETQTTFLQSELDQPFVGNQPSDEDLTKIQNLRSGLKQATKVLNGLYKKRIKIEHDREKLQRIINHHERTIQDLSNDKFLFRPTVIEMKISFLNEEIKKLTDALKHKTDVQNRILDETPKCEKNMTKLKEEESQLLDKQGQLGRLIAAGHPDIPKLEASSKRIQERLDECELKIKNFTGVPSGVQRYESKSTKNLVKQLGKVSKKLGKYKNVSRVVLDQYSQLQEQYDDIVEKKEQLEKTRESVRELTQTVEGDKQRRIIQYFRLLQRSFKMVFESLVESGRAELELYGEDFVISNMNENEELPDVSENDLTGVRLRVSFANSSASSVAQLSGGQKSLVSLALIMAIQKLDPVPIYLFDEIDQALDPVHREAVARVIDEMSSEAQFLCTTFRREFVDTGRSFYGVGYTNIASVIQKVSRDQALNFITDSNTSTSEASSTSFMTSSDNESVAGSLFGSNSHRRSILI